MKAGFTRRSQRPWRSALAGALLPLALAAAARTNQYEQPGGQAPLHGQITYPTTSATTAAAIPAPDDVAVFEQMADHMTIGQRVPGLAMAIVQNGRILSARGYGVTDVVAPQAVDAHTVFRLASLSKAFAGTVTGLLVNDGTLRWDTPVSDYVPGFHLVNEDATARLRVADVLSHRVGLRAHNAFDRDIEANASYQAVSGKLASVPLECLPGQCYAYQNVAFSLIGDVIASATGSSYEQEVRQRVFQPLGMKDASLGLDGILASAQWAKPHVRGRNGWVSQKPKPTYYRLPPAAGVNASISDMAQWLLAQTGHRPDVLPAPLLATLHAPLIATPGEIRGGWRRTRLSSAGYGLGWRAFDYAGHPVVFHAGAVSGYRGLVALLPEQDTGIALLWNSESNLPSGLLPTFIDHALGLQPGQWLDSDLPGREELLMAVRPSGPAASPTNIPAESLAPGSSPQRAAASPE